MTFVTTYLFVCFLKRHSHGQTDRQSLEWLGRNMKKELKKESLSFMMKLHNIKRWNTVSSSCVKGREKVFEKRVLDTFNIFIFIFLNLKQMEDLKFE